ncbi:MAG: DUF1015 domain-containing protein [Bacillota bacterium]|nr:DUF1015 domain-containing protein [Bacillota bacterium]
MADIKAFSAYRYAPQLPIADLITQPYDVISPEQQQAYYHRHAYNIIRLEYGMANEQDNDENNVYSRAAANFADWQAGGILLRDPQPAFYLYCQEFAVHDDHYRRSGFLATLKANGYDDGWVTPHEQTLPKHKADRLQLMHSTRANFSPIFGLYADEQRAVDILLREAAEARGDAAIDFVDDNGVRHLLWRIDDPAIVAAIEAKMAAQKIYIADGHHRYETASLFAQQMREQGVGDCDYIMINLVNLYDPGLVVLPFHRIVKNLPAFSAEELTRQLHISDFNIINISQGSRAADREHLLQKLADADSDDMACGLYTGGQYYLIKLNKQAASIAAALPELDPAARRLDVNIIHKLLLEDICGISPEDVAGCNFVDYSSDYQQACAMVDDGSHQFALLLNPTKVRELIEIADARQKMPQKSTCFFPKVIAGLTINKLEK